MEPVLIGYFPKKVAVPAGFEAPNIRDICGVSTCIAAGPPDGWIDLWLHNNHGVLPTAERARQVLQGVDPSEYSIHAYRMFPIEFDQGESKSIPIAKAHGLQIRNDVEQQPVPKSFCRLGFDAVEMPEACSFFSCSPLSCNGGWEEFETNEHCLVSSLSRAMELARLFSRGGWEPGPYRVVEVLGAAK